MTCSHCAHWAAPDTGDEPRCPISYGACHSPHFKRGYFSSDTLDEGFGLFTGPAFGCVHFAAEPAQ